MTAFGAIAATQELANEAFPTGTIIGYPSTTPPTGFLLCSGAVVPQASYPTLYATIGHTYGADPGGGNFTLPDGRGRTLFGQGTATSVASRGLDEGLNGEFGGTPLWTVRRPIHAHELQDHTHTGSGSTAGPNVNVLVSAGGSGATTNGHTHSFSFTSGGMSGADIFGAVYVNESGPEWLTVAWMVKT